MATAMTPAPAQAPSRQLTIRDQLRSPALLNQIAMVLPEHMKPERMVRVALTAMTRTPKLADCDQNSFFRCLLDLSQWGLEPDGRRAHLIPFENRKKNITECQLIIDYKGYVELAYRSGYVKTIHADVVRDGDVFLYNRGRVEQHVPWFLRRDAEKPDKAGDIYAVYCFVELKDGAEKSEALSMDEVEGIKNRSSGFQAFKKGYAKSNPWDTDYAEMAKKTAFRRVSKWIPLSAEIAEAFDKDSDRFEEVHAPGSAVAQAKDLNALAERLTHSKEPAADGPADNGPADNGPAIDQTAIDPAEGVDPPHADTDAQQDAPSGSPSAPTTEELADQEREQQAAQGKPKGSKLFPTHQQHN